MTRVSRFAGFWWSFVVGDDWRLAGGVLVAVGATAFLNHLGLAAWWLVPGAVALLLAGSLRRATRARHEAGR